MARSKKKFYAMKSKRSGKKTSKRITNNHKILKTFENEKTN